MFFLRWFLSERRLTAATATMATRASNTRVAMEAGTNAGSRVSADCGESLRISGHRGHIRGREE